MVVGLPVVLNIVNKMKISSKITIKFLIFLAFAGSVTVPAFADTRTATVRISCTILPILEIALPKTADQTLTLGASKTGSGIELKTIGNFVKVGTNLGKNYDISEVLLKRAEGPIRLCSVTAL